MRPNKKNSLLWLIGVAFMSAATLGLEIALTNVFSVLLQYHYVSFVVSLAVFGIGVGAYAARRSGAVGAPGWLCAITGVYIALLSLFLAQFPYVNQLALYGVLGAVPFAFFGWVMGKALSSGVISARYIYAADLLGAGIGVAAAYGLLHLFGGLIAMFAVSLFAFAGAIALFALSRGQEGSKQRKHYRYGLTLSAFMLLVGGPIGLFAGPAAGVWDIDFAGMKGAAPDKTLVGTLQSPGARIERTAWDEFARTDVVVTQDASRKMVFVGGGAGSFMYKFDGNLNSVAGLAKDIEFLPFVLGSAEKSIVVGSGGGRDILYTLLAGAKDVTAVELSGGIISNMREDAAYNGGLLDRPGVRTVVGDGRGVLEASNEKYDLIVLDLVYSQVGGMNGQSLSENYVFTQEAFETYLSKLNADGRIIVISHQGIEGIRAFYTGFAALLASTGGTPGEVANNTALVMAPEGSASPNLTLSVIQKSPLSAQQLSLLQAGVSSLGLQTLFLPQSYEQLLKPLLEGKMSFDKFVRDSDFNVYPTTDDRPFFYQLQPGLPDSLKTWLAVIVGLTVLFAVYVWWKEVAPVAEARNKGGNLPAKEAARIKLKFGPIVYFSLLGIGYMCLQLVLIQKTMVYAGSPVLSASVVIFAMLVGGSAGSRFAGSRRLTARSSLIAVVIVAILLAAVDATWGGGLYQIGIAMRLVLIGIAVGLLGFALGIPLPSRLETEERRQAGISPFLFAVNGIAGIWGSWLGSVVSMEAGLTLTLAAGCLCYLILAVSVWITKGRKSTDDNSASATAS
ncbi:hypothetical protein D7Z26_24170 [Cohnella endophytica]|uniref:MFS transporter n=1 Tax=Cohnella endophytica TaxID=2419778 RepID=A0A494X827_9BACL|nr:hypothetical protein [Cohnella endophytica]RKP46708.1 hypothetical protein D7Z26_24170 [Cohnella endophytica]